MTHGPQPPRFQPWHPGAGNGGFGRQEPPPGYYLPPGSYPPPPPPPPRHRLALVSACTAGAALLLCLLVQGLAILLGLVALVLGGIALVRVRGGRRPGQRLAVGALIGAVLAVIVGSATAPGVGSSSEQGYQRGLRPAASAAPAPPVATTTPPPSPTPTPAPPPAPIALAVSRVIDGDTFVVGTNMIRVLGIDSCGASTDAGPAATAQATQLLAAPVVLTSQPGVDRDPSGRLLRYVRLADGQDFARVMVAAPHTGVDTGRTGADPGYVASLQAADPDGRTCDYPEPAPAPAPTSTTQHQPYVDVPSVPEPDTYVPAPKRRTGHSGHPCLPGERDGDGDGYCGEK